MGGRERYVLLGLARARAEWFRDLARWSTAASLPADFLKCVSASELRARVATGRRFSAAVLDGSLVRVDRDLLAELRDAGIPPIVVDDGRDARDWHELGAVAVLPPTVGRELLLDVLASHATMIGLDEGRPAVADDGVSLPGELGRVVAVTGPGGTGASTVAAALAQGLAQGEPGLDVVLADLCLNAEQAMLHDSREVVPGIQELVDAHRSGTPTVEAVRSQTFAVERRGYHLLLGLRQARFWAGLRPRALGSSLLSLRRTFDVVVADIDPSLEGEAEGGSVDVEERHMMARTAATHADVVFAVGAPTMKGTYSLVRVLDELLAFGVPAARIVPVLTPAPRSPRRRAELARALAELHASPLAGGLPSPVFLPRWSVEEALRDGAELPRPLPRLLAGAYAAALDQGAVLAGRVVDLTAQPVFERVTPGSLGHLTDDAPAAPPPDAEGGLT